MIKCEVIFKGDDILVGNWLIFQRNDLVVAALRSVFNVK